MSDNKRRVNNRNLQGFASKFSATFQYSRSLGYLFHPDKRRACVHKYMRHGSTVTDSESFHADNRNMELVHHENNQDISKEETGNGNQKI